MTLAHSQSEAIRHVSGQLTRSNPAARAESQQVLKRLGVAEGVFHKMAECFDAGARIELSFHPDRMVGSTADVATKMFSEGVYRNQFETSISNGSLSAHEGGSRFEWEHRMFGGAYDGCSGSERPKYGALNLLGFADGSAPRFGSCYFGLLPSVTARSTFSYGDSVTEPVEIGTHQQFDVVWSAMIRDVTSSGQVLGLSDCTLPQLLRRITKACAGPDPLRFRQMPGRVLDDYVEAQVHGDILLGRDVEFLAIDPSFMGTSVGETLVSTAQKYGFPIFCHRGFHVCAGDIPEDFRGSDIPRLARRIADEGRITAREIGEAAKLLQVDPAAWNGWGTPAETLQHIKQLWHCLVAFGQPFEP